MVKMLDQDSARGSKKGTTMGESLSPMDADISLYHYTHIWKRETYHLVAGTEQWCRFMDQWPSKTSKLSFLLSGQLWPQLSKLLYLLISDNLLPNNLSSPKWFHSYRSIVWNLVSASEFIWNYCKIHNLYSNPNIDKVVWIPKNSDIQNLQNLICDHDLLETVIKATQ